MIFVQYLILVVLVVGLSVFLSKYVDMLDKKTDMSGAFIGGVLLAMVTSLPEFITSITSIFWLDQPSLVQGNVLGSNLFNLTILGTSVFLFSKKFQVAKLSKSHLTTSIVSFLMFITCYLAMTYNTHVNIGIFSISFGTILILILYIINIIKLNSGDDDLDDDDNDDDSYEDITVKQIVARFVMCAVLLVISSMFLTNVTDELTTQLNLGTTIGGAIFLGVATSLPELTSSVNLVRLGNFNAAFGNVIGSNLFNFAILSLGDVLYTKGNIFSPDEQVMNLIMWGFVATIFSILSLFVKKNQALSMMVGVAIIACYVSSILFSI